MARYLYLQCHYTTIQSLTCQHIVTTIFPILAFRWVYWMKTELMQLRLKLEEKEAFQQAADLAGIGLSAWVRERLRWAATRELENAGQSIPFLKHLAAEHDHL